MHTYMHTYDTSIHQTEILLDSIILHTTLHVMTLRLHLIFSASVSPKDS